MVAQTKMRLQQVEMFESRVKTAHENAKKLCEKINKDVEQFGAAAKQRAEDVNKAEGKATAAFAAVEKAAGELGEALAIARKGDKVSDGTAVDAAQKAVRAYVEATHKAYAALGEANRLGQLARAAFDQVLLVRNASVSAALTLQQTERTSKSATTDLEKTKKELEEAEAELKATVEATKQLESSLQKARDEADKAIAAANAAANEAAKASREGQPTWTTERRKLTEETRTKAIEATAKAAEAQQKLQAVTAQSERLAEAIAYNELQIHWAKTSEQLAKSLLSLTEKADAAHAENTEAAAKSHETITEVLKSLSEDN